MNAHSGQVQRMRDGSVLIKNARPLHAGLCAGSSDLIGWTVVEITPDMVGRKIAVFTAVESKTATGRATAEQLHFINTVRAAGGFSAYTSGFVSTYDVLYIFQSNCSVNPFGSL